MSHKKRNRVKHPSRRGTHPLIFIAGGLVLVGVAALLIFGGGSTAAPQAGPEVIGAPSLKANQPLVDLGNVRLGEWVRASFELTNVGDRPIVFTEQPYVEVVEGC